MQLSRRGGRLASILTVVAAVSAAGCGASRLPPPDPIAVAAQIAALPPCPEGAADAVDTAAWRTAPGLDSAARTPYWWAGLHLTLPPEFAMMTGIIPCHGGALWGDTAGQTPGLTAAREIGFCGGTYPLAKPDPARRRVAPPPLPSDSGAQACLLSFPLFGQRVALIRRRLPPPSSKDAELIARLGGRVDSGGPRGFLWTTAPLEHWEDVDFWARSRDLADTAVALRVLRGVRWTP